MSLYKVINIIYSLLLLFCKLLEIRPIRDTIAIWRHLPIDNTSLLLLW